MANGRPYRDGNLDKEKQKFLLQRCEPGPGKMPGEKYFFEGHIMSISDSSSPSWASYNDAGRPDPKIMYAQFARSVQIDFLVISTSKKEHDEFFLLMAKLGRLTYPIKKPNQGYNAPHVYYKIDELLSGIGVITNLSYSWNNETPWINGKPLYTEVSLSIMNLADAMGWRPSKTSKYFNGKI